MVFSYPYFKINHVPRLLVNRNSFIKWIAFMLVEICSGSGLTDIEAKEHNELFIILRRRLSESSSTRDVQTFVFYIVIGLIVIACGLYNACFKRRLEAELMRQQIQNEHTYRQDVIVCDEDAENVWCCEVCKFHNTPNQKSCLLCGTERGYCMFDKLHQIKIDVSDDSKGILSDLAPYQLIETTPRTRKKVRKIVKTRLKSLNPRQIGARRRDDWIKCYNSEGELVWGRNRDKIERTILSRASETDESTNCASRDSISSLSSQGSVGYVSTIVLTPKHPDGRMSFGLAEGNNAASENEGLNRSELDQVSSLSFQSKYGWFVQHTASLEYPWEYGHVLLDIDRQNLLHNSCEQLLWASPEQLRQSLRIRFINEPGIDAGGLEREWFTLMTEEIFADDTGLFLMGSCGGFYINPFSRMASEDHLMYFHAIGRFMGRALLEGVLLEAHLALTLYKHILGIPITFSDLQFQDYDLYKNLLWLKNNNGVESLCLDFSVTSKTPNGKLVTIDLIPNGRNIEVTNSNKKEYIEHRFKWAIIEGVSEQLASLVQGIFTVIPKELLSVFDYQELELLMCGVPEIDVEDWKKHTKYVGNPPEEVISWFWDVIESFSDEERARLLQFATGCARAPVQGFKALTMNDGRICYFSIQSITIEECEFPRAHTCFNRLDLPNYDSKEKLKQALTLVIATEVTGFSME